MKNSKLWIAICLFINAIAISIVAGGISIFGMILLFGAHALVVGIMIGCIEIGKISASIWLKLNWGRKDVSPLHKGYLLLAVVVTMLLTGIGVFGFLSSAHLEQNAPAAGLGIQSQQYQVQLDQANSTNKRLETRLSQIDANINAFLTAGSASKGLRASASLKNERSQIQTQMEDNNKTINDLNTKLAPLQQKSSEVEAKLGPVKYLASAAGYRDPEVAVRLVILLIMIAFDPLAVVLVMSGIITIKQWGDERADAANQLAVDALRESVDAKTRELSAQWTFEPTVEPEPEPVVEEPVVEEPVVETAPIPISFGVSGTIDPVIPGRFAAGEDIPVVVMAEGLIEPGEDVPDPMPTPIADIRSQLLDLMEANPSIVDELLEAAKGMDKPTINLTTSGVTGGTVD